MPCSAKAGGEATRATIHSNVVSTALWDNLNSFTVIILLTLSYLLLATVLTEIDVWRDAQSNIGEMDENEMAIESDYQASYLLLCLLYRKELNIKRWVPLHYPLYISEYPA